MNYDGKRWVFLVLCIVCNICAGVVYAWSVFVKPIAEQFQWSIAEASLSFAFMTTISAFLPMFAGKLQERVSPRLILIAGGVLFSGGLIALSATASLTQLYVFSVITGLGLALVYPSGTITNMIQFFPDRRGFASGLLTGGASLGAVVWAPVGAMLIETMGVLTTFKLLGIGFGITICLAAWMVETAPAGYRPQNMNRDESNLPSPQGGQAAAVKEIDWPEMLKSPLFYMISGAFFAAATSAMMFFGHVSPIAQDMLGVSAQVAAGVVVSLALANTLGRLIWGYISDKLGRFTVIYILLTMLLAAMVGLTQVTSYFAFVSMVMIVGLCYGGFFSILAPLLADLFGSRFLPVNFGIMFLMVGLGAFTGPRLAALIKAAYGDYSKAFFIAAALDLVGIILIFLASTYRQRKKEDELVLRSQRGKGQ